MIFLFIIVVNGKHQFAFGSVIQKSTCFHCLLLNKTNNSCIWPSQFNQSAQAVNKLRRWLAVGMNIYYGVSLLYSTACTTLKHILRVRSAVPTTLHGVTSQKTIIWIFSKIYHKLNWSLFGHCFYNECDLYEQYYPNWHHMSTVIFSNIHNKVSINFMKQSS
jgi:hypothetical protein